MTRAVTAALAWFPFDAGSRRALDEALLDWAFERAEARTAAARVVVDLRAVVSLVRTVAITVAFEVGRLPAGWLSARLLLLMAVPVAILSLAGWGHVPAGRAASGLWPQLALFVIPQAVLAVLPVALFLVSSARLGMPAIGLAAVVCTLALGLAAWAVPAGSRAYHVTAFAASRGSDSGTAALNLPLAPGDLGPAALAAAAVERPLGPAMGALLFRSGLALLASALVLLGAAASETPRTRRRRAVVAVSTAYVLAIAALPSTWELGGHTVAIAGLFPWLAAGLVLAGAVALRRALPQEGA